jgi:hypothetical protein
MTARNRQPGPASIRLEAGELAEVLAALDCAYESSIYWSDIGRIDFSTIGEPIVRALKILRRLRDEAAA